MVTPSVIDSGELAFSVEARLLRELGERLVRRPETALIELIKNSYDADAQECKVNRENSRLTVRDDGHGMTLAVFKEAWMKIGTASKAAASESRRFGRPITGEKGIGRFSVRFLGEHLELESVAMDTARGHKTRLRAVFDWPLYDASEDIGRVKVPYELWRVDPDAPTGTTLQIARLRPAAAAIDEGQVRTASIGLVSPIRSLLTSVRTRGDEADPGFRLTFGQSDESTGDIAEPILRAFALRARLTVHGRRVNLRVTDGKTGRRELEISEQISGECGDIVADIRFFPRRAGAFRGLGVDGRVAYSWIKDNSGVAVFDRDFRVSPYGEPGDDWLGLAADAARNARKPRSGLAVKHFPMSEAEQSSTADNWMLRLPLPSQLVGVVQATGRRGSSAGAVEGLVAAADREGFVANGAFEELRDLVRGAVEAIAMVDRRLQKRQEEAERTARLARLQAEAAAAAEAVEQNPNLPAAEKRRIVNAISAIASDASAHEEATRERVRQLETMSLLGVVAGFMTHEFGVALDELDTAYQILTNALISEPKLQIDLARLELARKRLGEFTDYSTAYIRGSRRLPETPYLALPRLKHVCKTFAVYAAEREVDVEIHADKTIRAPRIPTSLYDGIVLNLFTNALKAVTGATQVEKRVIAFRVWNERGNHFLEVSDTGVGVPEVLRERVFDPLFTTTDSRNDPLGSGMGLGLSLVRASAEAFGGRVKLVDPPPGFSTCAQVRFPLDLEEEA